MRRYSSIRGIVFDLDGTLIDSYDAIAESLNAALDSAGLPALPAERVREMVGMGLETLVARAMGEERVEEGVRLFRERYDRICVDKTTLLPQVAETLDILHRRGYLMSVASNKPSKFGWRLLEGLHVRRYLVTVLGPDVVENRKPHPEMVELAMSRMGVGPDETLFVGDMEIDVETARAAGLPVIVVPTGSRTSSELGAAGADLIIPDLRALLDLLPGPPPARGSGAS
jgi:2-phosphoglycolate phosphatase